MAQTFIYPPPRDGKPFRLNMGLRSLEEAAWLEDGDDLITQIAERITLATNARDIVYRVLPGYEAPINELVERIADNLKKFHSGNYSFEGSVITHKAVGVKAELSATDALLQIATIIAEDIVVLSRQDNEWKIVAGAVLFPSRWKLSEKIGKGMDTVHAPVPGYQNALAPYMTATFDKISADRSVWRKNWSLHSTEDLHQPTSIHEIAKPEQYWWRSERQTLTRSHKGDFLFFTIRNRAEPLAWIKSEPGAAALFAETLSSFAPETIEYKGLQRDHQEIIDYLRN
jgi:hypothetical protein